MSTQSSRPARPSRVSRVLPRLLAAILAGSVFALSAVAVTQVAAGEPPLERGAVPAEMAWLVPIIVDGTILTALAVAWLRRARGSRAQWLPGLVAAAALAVSTSVNLARVSPGLLPGDVLYTGLGVLPPLVLAAAAYLGFAADAGAVAPAAPTWSSPAETSRTEVDDGPRAPQDVEPEVAEVEPEPREDANRDTGGQGAAA